MGHGKGTFDPAANRVTKLRFVEFREACLRYIKKSGPTLDRTLLEGCRTVKENKCYNKRPRSTNSLNNLLRRDSRFYFHDRVGRDAKHSRGMIWGFVGDDKS